MHAQKVDILDRMGDGARLCGVMDIRPERSRILAERFGVPAVQEAKELFERYAPYVEESEGLLSIAVVFPSPWGWICMIPL